MQTLLAACSNTLYKLKHVLLLFYCLSPVVWKMMWWTLMNASWTKIILQFCGVHNNPRVARNTKHCVICILQYY